MNDTPEGLKPRTLTEMKQLALVVLLTLTSLSFGQTIQEIFKSLPLDYTFDLSNDAKDSLIKNGIYTVPGGDSIETIEVEYRAKKDFISLTYYFTTGQSGFSVVEIRKFQKTDDTPIVVYSKYGGAMRAFDQHSLLTFDYKNGILTRNRNLGLPETIETKEFLKDSLPDDLNNDNFTLSTSYDLMPEEPNCVEYQINPQSNLYDEWIKTFKYSFLWNGEKFKRRFY